MRKRKQTRLEPWVRECMDINVQIIKKEKFIKEDWSQHKKGFCLRKDAGTRLMR